MSSPSPVTAEIRTKGRSRDRHVRLERIDGRRIGDRVHLRGRDDLRLRGELVVEERKLALDRLEIFDRIPARGARHVDEVNEHLRAIEVLQKAIAEPAAFVRALDEPGHVGDDEAAIVR